MVVASHVQVGRMVKCVNCVVVGPSVVGPPVWAVVVPQGNTSLSDGGLGGRG